MNPTALQSRHLSVVTRHADQELTRIQEIIEHKVLVDGRSDLEELLGRLLAHEDRKQPRTLDLVGHSTSGHSLLTLGDWVIDVANPTVSAFFRGLADDDVLPRLGIHTVRLLGCQTADTRYGRATICGLSDILALEVQGTNQLIYSAHYDSNGFKAECQHVLVRASDLRADVTVATPADISERYPRMLDIDALPSAPLIVRDHPWPRRVASSEIARSILKLVRRADGAEMPGLLSTPSCEIALPAARPNWYHLAQVLLDGEFVRVYPEGNRKPGVVYPVVDPHALRCLVDTLPPVPSVD